MPKVHTVDETHAMLKELVAERRKKKPTVAHTDQGVVAELITKAHRREVVFTRKAEVELYRIDQGDV